MIYGHIPVWMREENPAFWSAVLRHYSIEYGSRKAAALGELAFWRICEQTLSRPLVPVIHVLLRAMKYVLPRRQRVWKAVGETDSKFLRRVWGAMEAFQQEHIEAHLADIEYIFEAYYFLRKRDGEGSPLPNKHEVVNMACEIEALFQLGLKDKIPQWLWRQRGLTGPQAEAVLARKETLLGDDRVDRQWRRRLKTAGLDGLPSKPRGEDRGKRFDLTRPRKGR
jgi:hypothetical protein